MTSYRLILETAAERPRRGLPACPPFLVAIRTVARSTKLAGGIREALGLWVDDAATAGLDEEIHLPRRARQVLRRSLTLRERAIRERAEAQAATADAASVLVDELDLGMRDAAELLGVSRQRVQQLLAS